MKGIAHASGVVVLLLVLMALAAVASAATAEVQPRIDWHAAVTNHPSNLAMEPDASIVLSCPGCCSSHGGISSTCSSSGRIYCNDGTVSPSCSCSSCGVSTTPTCTGGQYYDGTRCVCPSNQILINGQCTACTNGHVVSGSSCVCPTGKIESGGYCVSAQVFVIGGGISGNWYNPTQSGHGFQFEVLKDPPGYATAFWFVFDKYGNQAWIAGTGKIAGNTIVMDASRRVGALFPPYFQSSDAQGVAWGTLTFTFSDCTHGHVAWSSVDPTFTATGAMDLVRLTQIVGTNCP